jgi:hypothetical protein
MLLAAVREGTRTSVAARRALRFGCEGKLLLERRLSAEAQGFILPEDRAAEKASRVTIRAAVDAYLESLRIKKPPTKTISSKTYELGLFTGFCKKSYMDELVSADMLGFRDYLRSEKLHASENYAPIPVPRSRRYSFRKAITRVAARNWRSLFSDRQKSGSGNPSDSVRFQSCR